MQYNKIDYENRLQTIRTLGKGSFGSVYLAYHLGYQIDYVKIFQKEQKQVKEQEQKKQQEQEKELVQKEEQAKEQCYHPHNLLVHLSTFIQRQQASADLIQMSSTIPQASVVSFNTTWKKSDFDRKERLGKGAFGVVRHVIERKTQLHAAWKEVNYETPEEIEMVNNEIEIMKKIYGIVLKTNSSFIHIVQPLGFFTNQRKDKAYIVLEYCSEGDLRQYIDNMKKSGTIISPQKTFEMIFELAYSLYQLHSNGILHADLKPENILLVGGFKVKLADFGLAHQFQVGREWTTAHGGTFPYKAPEIMCSKNNDKQPHEINKLKETSAADIWAFGVMIFELIAQRHPFFNRKVCNN
ncbi:MAG: putative MAP kinase kinase family domain protein [Streblomastix strix]|uniref:Putative MAP kinase kinase family domain protein n=1 Tax=Streblomastix strix TaxID=222440 RepID=A0A5J4UE82_9EUKA|nr:MAG: putative MAP kinase kinase family domain protein [Streblomastix strix]